MIDYAKYLGLPEVIDFPSAYEALEKVKNVHQVCEVVCREIRTSEAVFLAGWFELYVQHIDRHGCTPDEIRGAIYEAWADTAKPHDHRPAPIYSGDRGSFPPELDDEIPF